MQVGNNSSEEFYLGTFAVGNDGLITIVQWMLLETGTDLTLSLKLTAHTIPFEAR